MDESSKPPKSTLQIHNLDDEDFRLSEYRDRILPILNGLSIMQIDRVLDNVKWCATGQKILFEHCQLDTEELKDNGIGRWSYERGIITD